MPEHRIQLRKAWLEHRDATETQRLDLPLSSPPDRPLHLTRLFGSPPIDPTLESLSLHLANVPGLRRLLLNGQVLINVEPTLAAPPDYDLPLSLPLPARNRLELHAVPLSDIPHPPTPWGHIALVIRS